jgi:PAP2 superfamily protein
MRSSEWVSTGVLALFLLLSFVRRIPFRNRFTIIALSLIGFALIRVGIHYYILRDWIPVLLMLIIYWQGGAFYTATNKKLQQYLEQFETKVSFMQKIPLHDFWEAAYFLCYPLVPAAVVTLKLLHQSSQMDFFWMTVLPPTYTCHVIVSFFPTLPPWKSQSTPEFNRISRRLNWFVVQHLSNRINTFPSAHVAASIAIALAMLQLRLVAGLVFLFLAVSITLSTIVGRYHYTADAFWGMVLALIWLIAMLI